MDKNSEILNISKPNTKILWKPPKAIHLILIGSLTLNGYFLFFVNDGEAPKMAVAEASLERVGPKKLQAEKNIVQPVSEAESENHAIKGNMPKPVPTKPVVTKRLPLKKVLYEATIKKEKIPYRSMHLRIRKSLNYSICKALSQDQGCQQLSAYVARLLVWFLDINREIRNGDELALVFESLEGEGRFKILKLRYRSEYFAKAFEANFFNIPGMKYGTYFDSKGNEIHATIVEKESPIREYSDITSLPGDYRRSRFRGHRGTDFKAPVGTPVYASFDGKVLRRNWNVRSNGLSLKIEHPKKGLQTFYLHLNKVLVKRGEYVKQGQKIAESGNTGRSFAPHLHYEVHHLNAKKTILNPFKSEKHRKIIREVPSSRMRDYLQQVSRYDSWMKRG